MPTKSEWSQLKSTHANELYFSYAIITEIVKLPNILQCDGIGAL